MGMVTRGQGRKTGLEPGLVEMHESLENLSPENYLARALALALALSRYLVTNARSEAWHQSR
jgi:hypothetical protein